MSKIDDMIREALQSSDRDVLGQTDELGYFALGLQQFRGKLGWITWVIMIVQASLFLIGVWCIVAFFQAGEVLPALKWGLSGAVAVLMAIQIKLSLMPQMQADRVIRELKRVELLVISQRSAGSRED